MEEQKARRRFSLNMTKGGKNLVILGVVSILVAIATTGVSLLIYHNSGDIYLDRSRPGYLPDESEVVEDDVDDDYDFSKVDKLDIKVVEDYIDNLDIELRAIDEVKDPFGAEVLSDKGLGIVEKSE
ncbi:hypothetical protein IJG89_02005 [Candidatus Saccharibacteria bacterium]|nr:hypothetical protein [Candidatus Saccharibacteria bacterium]